MRTRKKKIPGIVRRGSTKNAQEVSPTVCLQVGRTSWENVPKIMRAELWMSVMHRRRLGMAAAEKYEELLSQALPTDVEDTISRDLARTFPDMRRFTSVEGQESLGRVLRAYAAYDPEVGYCQGMNFLAGMLLMYMPTERFAFGALELLMQERNLRGLYDTDMSLLQVHLKTLEQLIPKRIMEHLETAGCPPVLFASSWILTCFASDFPYQVAGRIIDVLMGDSFEAVVLKVSLTIITKYEKEILGCRDMEAIVHFLGSRIPTLKEARIHEVVSEALATPWTSSQLTIINSACTQSKLQEAENVDTGALKANLGARLEAPPSPAFQSPRTLAKPPPVVTNEDIVQIAEDSSSSWGTDIDLSFGPFTGCSASLQQNGTISDDVDASIPSLPSSNSWVWVTADASPTPDKSLLVSPPNKPDSDVEESIKTWPLSTPGLPSRSPVSNTAQQLFSSEDSGLSGINPEATKKKFLSVSYPQKESIEFDWISEIVRDGKKSF